jgi:hypothetical protein
MSELSAGQNARQMLERQLAALGSLYNAGVRSPNFREWRQATLTCIQRIWPAEPARPERFRRIPFSPPMGRPGEREVREYYERGCGEAGSLLKDYIAEIATSGLPSPGAGSVPAAGAPPVPGRNDDDFPTVNLPGPGAGGGSAPSPPKPRLKDLLGFSEADPSVLRAAPAPIDTTAAGAPPLSQHSAPAPAAAPPAPAAGSVEQAMAELESHGFFAPPGHVVREAPAPGPAASPAEPIASAPPPQPRIVVTGTEQPVGAAPPPVTAPGHSVSQDAERAVGAAAARVDDPNDLGQVAEDLLRASSALSSLPRRATQDRRTSPRDIRSPIPLAIAALALEVEALGVPEGHRSRTRAVLLDLSRRLDAPNLSWEALREAMSFVMEFPSLGRRMVPLLLPYLDRAA